MKINVVSKQVIKPSSPTPPDRRDYKLSFIEEVIPHVYIPFILYYFPQKNNSNIKRPQVSKCLKKSLSETLTQFYPMAGRIKGRNLIDCNDEGVFYAEAEVDGHLSELLHQTPDVQILDQFSPSNSYGTETDAKELLAIQVNFFRCGGLAIGICLSHKIGDGCSLCWFIKGWAVTAAEGHGLEPDFKAASLFPSRESSSPDIRRPNPQALSLQPPVEKLVTKWYTFSSSEIESLKSKVMARWSTEKPTKVEVVSAWIWKCCMSAAGLGENDPVNLRRRMIPPLLPDSSFGNIFQKAHAEAKGWEDWIGLVEKLRIAIGKIDQNYCEKLLGENGFEVARSNFSEARKYLLQKDLHVVCFSSWCGFPLYEADFRWGIPVWVSSTSYSRKNKMCFYSIQDPLVELRHG